MKIGGNMSLMGFPAKIANSLSSLFVLVLLMPVTTFAQDEGVLPALENILLCTNVVVSFKPNPTARHYYCELDETQNRASYKLNYGPTPMPQYTQGGGGRELVEFQADGESRELIIFSGDWFANTFRKFEHVVDENWPYVLLGGTFPVLSTVTREVTQAIRQATGLVGRAEQELEMVGRFGQRLRDEGLDAVEDFIDEVAVEVTAAEPTLLNAAKAALRGLGEACKQAAVPAVIGTGVNIGIRVVGQVFDGCSQHVEAVQAGVVIGSALMIAATTAAEGPVALLVGVCGFAEGGQATEWANSLIDGQLGGLENCQNNNRVDQPILDAAEGMVIDVFWPGERSVVLAGNEAPDRVTPTPSK